MTDITLTTSTLGEILSQPRLYLPAYQRPYKWGRQQIRHWFYDVKEAMARQTYQIGTLILHNHQERQAIVDGQQRLISVALFLHALGDLEKFAGAKQLLSHEFNDISCHHAVENVSEWQHLISLDEEQARQICQFLLDNCQVSVISIPEERLSEAFQLFDAQNNRGKSLEPYDLLKAYHLRTIDQPNEETIRIWEEIVHDDQLNLKTLFNQHLFRLRRWVTGETGLTKKHRSSYLRFTEAYVDDFKGVDLKIQTYPYLELYRLLPDFPKSLTMPIINGQAFFDYVAYAHQRFKALEDSQALDSLDNSVLGYTKNLSQRYSRNKNLFYNSLALYYDRFGEDALDKEVLETLFVWAYYPRIESERIYDSTIANYAAGGSFQKRPVQKLFQLLNRSISPTDFLQNIKREHFNHLTAQMIVEKLNEKQK